MNNLEFVLSKDKKGKTIINLGETYFQWWLNDLKEVGLVRSYKREPFTLPINEPIIVYNQKNFKKKDPIWINKTLFASKSYTMDYEVEFHHSLVNKLFLIFNQDDNKAYNFTEQHPSSKKGIMVWNEVLFKACYSGNPKNYCYKNFDEYIKVHFDVKLSKNQGAYRSVDTTITFPFTSLMLYMMHKIYVNVVYPSKLFEQTFTPKRYLFTDKSMKPRKINFKVNTIENWMRENGLKKVDVIH